MGKNKHNIKSTEFSMSMFLLTAFGCATFIFLTFISMEIYPGSTALDNETIGYSFTENFFSDLGQYRTYSGESNFPGALLFMIASVIAGLLLIPYFITIYPYLNCTERGRKWAKAALYFAIPSSIAYAMIGIISADINYGLHLVAVGIAFLGSIIVLFFNYMAIRAKSSFPPPLKIGYVLLMGITVGYILSMIISGYISSDEPWLLIGVIGQKICVYSEMIWGIFEGVGSSYYLRRGDIKIEN